MFSPLPEQNEPAPHPPPPLSKTQRLLSWASRSVSGMYAEWYSMKNVMVRFSSIAIALYGYDQGMMSLVNTNQSYLRTMAIPEDSPFVGVIVSIYYIGCLFGAILASFIADKRGRKTAIWACLWTSVIGDILMFIPGIYPFNCDNPWRGASIVLMIVGRVVLGLGIGGIDAVIPIYSSELSKDDSRGSSMAKEFQANILGLLTAFGINVFLTHTRGKDSELAWRFPIAAMLIFPIVLLLIVRGLPESPRWFISQGRLDHARDVLLKFHGEAEAEHKLEELCKAQSEEMDHRIGYYDMVWPTGSQFHPTMITVMGQINQALTGYGAVSVYGPQIFELLGFPVREAELWTLGNYFFYATTMTLAWILIDQVGRRRLMLIGSVGLSTFYLVLTFLGSQSVTEQSDTPEWLLPALGIATLYTSTATFGICWLTTVWLIPTEIYPNCARAAGSSISVIIWGLSNFVVTLLTPIGFNNLKYWLFLVFAITNIVAGVLTWLLSPETGGRSFEENQRFFALAKDDGSWLVRNIASGKYRAMPRKEDNDEDVGVENAEVEDSKGENARGENSRGQPSETTPLLGERIE
ncbi:general substrate transporter [Annulohypoxylon maeteangense]|uniref:general substrate transporter n=1 Tax=Annulohypoxylon maeteangense TaxID=1927788 RepID=UPI0020074A3A|nr:general substrate transporter [Annulohypoxylon maeteangense]KAI0886280.1 general substrate transporter [Annulohypoxylon maeteangense]